MPYSLWAKTNDRDTEREAWASHPLPLHLLDVGHVAEMWLDADPFILARLQALWPALDPDGVRRLAVIASALHDTGKVDAAFQVKSDEGWARGYGPAWKGALPAGTGFDHGLATARIFERFAEKASWGRLVPPPYAARAFADVMRVSGGHHGKLFGTPGDIPTSSPQERAALVALVALVEQAFGPLPDLSATPEPPPPAFLMLLAGFISVADWLGSDDRFFPFSPSVSSHPEALAYLSTLRNASAAHHATHGAWGALSGAGLLGRAEEGDRTFLSLFGFTPRPGFQSDALAVPFGEAHGAEIAIVEAPMGLGKTEIALALAARALGHGTARGLYFALPTQASADALYRRVARFAGQLARPADARAAPPEDPPDHPREAQPLALALAHGASRFHRDHRRLTARSRGHAPQGSASDEASPPSELIAPAWLDGTRRALLAPVGLGTIDQALLGALAVRHGFVRLFGMAGKVVVLDEVHAYDAYMQVLIGRLLEWLAALGAKVVVLSATLSRGSDGDLGDENEGGRSTDTPPLRSGRAGLLAAFGVPHVARDEARAVPEDVPYPRLLHARLASPEVHRVEPPTEDERAWETPTTPIALHGVEAALPRQRGQAPADDPVTLAGVAWVQDALRKGGAVAWIRNTVREAQAAATLLRSAGHEVTLLHARRTRRDRGQADERLLDAYGPPAEGDEHARARPRSGLIVATQVIEQSIDVDFDAMLTDLAPADLLLQRAGRMHRHPRTAEARAGHPTARLAVLLPHAQDRAALRFGVSARVYDAETLARSAVLVLDAPRDASGDARWTLPSDARRVVAALYDHDDDPDGAATAWTATRLGCTPDRLTAVRTAHQKDLQRQTHKGRSGLTSAPHRPGVPSHLHTAEDVSDHVDVSLTTRLGRRTLTLTLLVPHRGRLVFHGSTHPVRVPGDTRRARLATEEALFLATVSAPWPSTWKHDDRSRQDPFPLPIAPLPPEAEAFRKDYAERRRFDERLFLPLTPHPDGHLVATLAGMQFTYTAQDGLAIEPLTAPLPAPAPPSGTPVSGE